MAAQPQPADTTNAPAVTGAVTTAFALGWQMARLFTGPLSSNSEPKLDEDLPGLGDLPAGTLVTLGLAQADLALAKLGTYLGADAQLPDTSHVVTALAQDPPDRDAIRRAILELHAALLVGLTAADYRLGKAYGLGRALADTCSSARGDESERKRALEHHLNPYRALEIVGWLDDLKTVLPAHSGQAVADSLERWKLWAQTIDLDTLDPQAVNATTRVLHRCGQRWRAILSGEKDAKDMLEITDYVGAAQSTLAQAATIGRSLAARLWAPLALAVVLIAVGIALMIANDSTAQVLAGLGSVAAGLGVTWRSAAGTLGHLSLDLGRPLWGAQIDLAVGNRLTPLLQRDYVPRPDRPQGRWLRAWHELRTADPEVRPGAPVTQKPAKPDGSPDVGSAEAGREQQEKGNADTAVTEAVPEKPADPAADDSPA